ncbi:MAG: hypothetical protein HZC49_08090 [Nitrospirae bacterium]|nr:hypothetical protein [Nitrospirota bacterium]
MEKKLFSWQIPKKEVETIKNTILNNGYKRVGKDNHHYKGAITTLYEKEIVTTKINSKIQILLSFKETCIYDVYHQGLGIRTVKEEPCPDSTFYRNLGISISNLDRDDITEINDEVNRIEEILYRKLLEVAGEENVVRGERR